MTERKVAAVVAAALIFLVVWAIGLLTSVGERDAAALSLAAAGSVLAGALADDWRVLVLALAVIPLAALQSCDEESSRCEIGAAGYAAFVLAPLAAALLGIGVGLRHAIVRRRRGTSL